MHLSLTVSPDPPGHHYFSPDTTSLAEVHCATEISCINILTGKKVKNTNIEYLSRLFIGPCIILIVEETNLMSLTFLFHYLMINMF
jgi:hypothetical protein